MSFENEYKDFIHSMILKNGQPSFEFKYKAKNRREGFCVHHISPSCLGGSNDPSNLVYLTNEEHYHAHRLLAKFAGNKLIYTFKRMTDFLSSNDFPTDEDWSFIKSKMKDVYSDPEFRKRRSEASKKFHFEMSDEERCLRGKSISEGYKKWSVEKREKVGKEISTRMKKPVIGTCISTGNIVEFECGKDTSKQGFKPSKVSECCNNKRESHNGYTWKFKEQI